MSYMPEQIVFSQMIKAFTDFLSSDTPTMFFENVVPSFLEIEICFVEMSCQHHLDVFIRAISVEFVLLIAKFPRLSLILVSNGLPSLKNLSVT